MKAALKLLIAAGLTTLFVGCGTPGAPQPPSLELARPPQDLAATRKGSKVTLTWTPPTQTTDGQNIRAKYAGPTLVCRAVSPVPVANCQTVAQLPASAQPVPKKGEKKPSAPPKSQAIDVLPADLQEKNASGFAEYGVQVTNSHGRAAGISNQASIPLAPTLPPPSDLSAQVTAEAILLSWTGVLHTHENPEVRHAYRIYRQQGEEPATPIGEVMLHQEPQASFEDRNFEWEKTYSYWVTVVTLMERGNQRIAEVEGDDSPQVKAFAHDVFPPAVPVGVEAVASGVGQKPFVDLTWTPDSDTDLAGYNVYRQEDGRWVKVNPELGGSPSFRDENVVSGKSYTYAVTAVDVRGNESQRSVVASESVP